MDWIFWAVTTAAGLVVGALAFFIKRTLGELEKAISNLGATFKDQTDKLEKRISAQEDRHNQLIKDLPTVYAYREDMIRYSQDTNSRLDKVQDLLLELIRGGKCNG